MVNDKTKTNVREFKQSAFTLVGGHEPEDSAMPGRRMDNEEGMGLACTGCGIQRNILNFSEAVFSCDYEGKT